MQSQGWPQGVSHHDEINGWEESMECSLSPLRAERDAALSRMRYNAAPLPFRVENEVNPVRMKNEATPVRMENETRCTKEEIKLLKACASNRPFPPQSMSEKELVTRLMYDEKEVKLSQACDRCTFINEKPGLTRCTMCDAELWPSASISAPLRVANETAKSATTSKVLSKQVELERFRAQMLLEVEKKKALQKKAKLSSTAFLDSRSLPGGGTHGQKQKAHGARWTHLTASDLETCLSMKANTTAQNYVTSSSEFLMVATRDLELYVSGQALSVVCGFLDVDCYANKLPTRVIDEASVFSFESYVKKLSEQIWEHVVAVERSSVDSSQADEGSCMPPFSPRILEYGSAETGLGRIFNLGLNTSAIDHPVMKVRQNASKAQETKHDRFRGYPSDDSHQKLTEETTETASERFDHTTMGELKCSTRGALHGSASGELKCSTQCALHGSAMGELDGSASGELHRTIGKYREREQAQLNSNLESAASPPRVECEAALHRMESEPSPPRMKSTVFSFPVESEANLIRNGRWNVVSVYEHEVSMFLLPSGFRYTMRKAKIKPRRPKNTRALSWSVDLLVIRELLQALWDRLFESRVMVGFSWDDLVDEFYNFWTWHEKVKVVEPPPEPEVASSPKTFYRQQQRKLATQGLLTGDNFVKVMPDFLSFLAFTRHPGHTGWPR